MGKQERSFNREKFHEACIISIVALKVNVSAPDFVKRPGLKKMAISDLYFLHPELCLHPALCPHFLKNSLPNRMTVCLIIAIFT
ncbi:MAG: hypothetical protein ACRD63_06355, partial [Pyrinomonadaceae bacterium]